MQTLNGITFPRLILTRDHFPCQQMPPTDFPEVCSGLMSPASPSLPASSTTDSLSGCDRGEPLNGDMEPISVVYLHTPIRALVYCSLGRIWSWLCVTLVLFLVHYKFQWDSADSFWGQPGVNAPSFITCCGQERERIWQPNVFRDVCCVALWTVPVLANVSLRVDPSLQGLSASHTWPGESKSTWTSSTQWAWLAPKWTGSGKC